VRLSGRSSTFVVVRATKAADGWLEITELYMEGGLSNYQLAALGLAQLRTLLNTPSMRGEIEKRIDLPAPLLRVAASHYATNWGGAAFDDEGRGMHWAAEMWASQLPDSGVAQATSAKDRRGRPVRLEPPPTVTAKSGRKPDSFYESVGAAYLDFVSRGEPPAPAIARSSGVPVTTVHRWIRRARELGLLPAARGRGRAG
jgi:hypothetical protein